MTGDEEANDEDDEEHDIDGRRMADGSFAKRYDCTSAVVLQPEAAQA